MQEHLQPISSRIHSDHACIVDEGSVTFEEKNESGAGRVTFNLPVKALKVVHNGKPPMKWAKNQKCADGALIYFADNEVYLHIIELKKKVTVSNWPDIKLQFEGMALNAKAMMGVSDVPQPTTIICHIGYEQETISPELSTDPALLKFQLGNLAKTPLSLEWENCKISLLNFSDVLVRKIVRDSESSEGEGTLN